MNELDLDLAGKSIRGIWKVLEQVLNIPRDAAVSVNGDRVPDDYVVRPGDEIEFQKQAGVKGLPERPMSATASGSPSCLSMACCGPASFRLGRSASCAT